MKAILDTHTFLWWNADDPQLSELAREIIADGQNQLFLSAASTWEIAIKTGRGRLTLPEPPEEYIPSRMSLHRIQALPIQVSHSLRVFSLPTFHNDPFDRLLVAQSQMEKLPLISKDTSIAQYAVEILW
jgi:PIN domain nuclease of toxin-antitoxin system